MKQFRCFDASRNPNEAPYEKQEDRGKVGDRFLKSDQLDAAPKIMTRHSAQHVTLRTAHRALLAAGLSLLLGLGVTIVPSGSTAQASQSCLEAVGSAPLQGAGTAGDPYKVGTPEQLSAVRCNLSAHYIQTANINLISFTNWLPIGMSDGTAGISSGSFSGTFDGDNFRISNLTVDRPSNMLVGLFSQATATSTIKQVRLENIDVYGDERVGGLIGRTSGNVELTSVEGKVRAERERVGGIVGQSDGNASIEQYNAFFGSVEGGLGPTAASSFGIGGIVGRTSSNSSVSEVYVRGTITGNRAGGIVGSTSTVNSVLKESYASVEIKTRPGATPAQVLGGAVAGRVEAGGDNIQNSVYWNKELFEEPYGPDPVTGSTRNAIGLQAEDMRGESAVDEMDNLNWAGKIWQTVTIPNDDFPVFSWQSGAKISIEVVVTSSGQPVTGADVRVVSRDLFFRDVTTTLDGSETAEPLEIYQDVHQTVTVSADVGGETFVATIAGPFDDEDTITADLGRANVEVSSSTVAVDDDSDGPVGSRTTTFTAGATTATLSATDVRDALIAGDVVIVSSGNIVFSEWVAPVLPSPRTLTLQAGRKIAMGGDEEEPVALGLNSATSSPLTINATAGGDITLRASESIHLGTITAGGRISITTTSDDITLTDSVSTTDSSLPAIEIGAGKDQPGTTFAGGSIVFADGVDNNGVFSTGPNGAIRLFTGDVGASFEGFEATRKLFGQLATNPPASEPAEPASIDLFVRGPQRPDQPTIDIVVRATEVDIVITPPGNAGDTGVTGFEYSIDGGNTWLPINETPDPNTGVITFTIDGQTEGSSLGVQVRVLSTVGGVDVVTEFPALLEPIVFGNALLETITLVFDDDHSDIIIEGLNDDGFALGLPTSVTGVTVTAELGAQAIGNSYSLAINGTTVVSGESYAEDDTLSGTRGPIKLDIGQNAIIITTQSGSAKQTITLQITRQAPPAPPQQPTQQRPRVPAVVEPAPSPVIPSVPSRMPSGTTPIPTPSAPLTGPVITPGVTPQAPATPTGTVGGVPVPTQSQVTGTNQLRVTTGVTSLGLTIPQGGGQVSSGPTTEIALPVGGSTSVNASGLLPGSRVQVFIPIAGGDFRELAPLAVNEQGQASGDIVFAPRTNEPPLPIGRQVMQITSVDEAGQRVTVDMAVVIAQGSPTPEVNREDGTLPTLPPGRSLATEAGLPVPVTVEVDQDLVTTVITGDGWSFAVDVSGEGSQVQQTPDGEVFLSVIRGTNAQISGVGFMPNTRADVWLFSDPTLLGTLDVNEQGEVTGQVNFDARVIAQGNHTIQIQGVGTDGFIRAASLGVEVADPADAPAVDSGDSAVSFIWWALAALLLIAIITAVVLWARNRAAVN